MEKLVLIDGNSLINRAFYALPPLNNADGMPTQAVYGFATMLIKAISELKPDYIAVAFDLPKPTFRHLAYSGYKEKRKKMPDELRVQMPLLKDMLRRMNIACVEKEGFEADDIIGTLAKLKLDTFIVTGDRDSLQLIDDTTTVLLTKKGISEVATLNEAALKEQFSLTPAQVIDYKALAGDASDNIPGVAGVGEKTATALIGEYGCLDNVYAHLEDIKGKLGEKLAAGRESAYLSYMLATIKTDVELDVSATDFGYTFPFPPAVREFFDFNGFKTLLKRDELFDTANLKKQTVKPPAQVVAVSSGGELSTALGAAGGVMCLHAGETVNFAFSPEREYCVSLAYSLIDNGMETGAVLAALKTILEDGSVEKVVYDAKRLKKLLAQFKISLNNFYDVKLAQYLVAPDEMGETLSESLGLAGMDALEPATALWALKESTRLLLEERNMLGLYTQVELPLVDVLYDMEKTGARLDLALVDKLGGEFTAEGERMAEKIYELCGAKFNINSPKQLAKVLFEDMGLQYPKKSKSYSTAAEILQLVEHPVIPYILEYRFVTKLNSTYIEGLKKQAKDGVVHTDYKQMLTTTGRLSSTEPNIQNIPVREERGKELRAMFIPSEGNLLVSADYSQIELRLLAHFSGDEVMIRAYADGEDIHAATASKVFDVPPGQVTSAMRRDAKAVNFGIIYGISDFGLAQNLKIPPYKARKYINEYFSHFPAVKKYLDESVDSARALGYAVTVLGRRRYIPELKSPNFNVRSFGERVAMNMPLQGSAADIIKVAMVKVHQALKGMKSRLILQIHDELIVDAHNDEVEAVVEILNRNMSGAAELKVPLEVDIGVGKSWKEC